MISIREFGNLLCGAALCALLFTPAHAAQVVPEVTSETLRPLATLREGHPRLMALDDELSRTRELIRTDPLARQWHQILRKQADQLIGEPPVVHKLTGPRLLPVSRAAMARIHLLGLLYRLDGDARYAERAEKELLAVCAFPDWNPSHFLDTAEMSNAVGIGYDWLYHALSPQSRATIREALVRLGMEPAMKLYRTQKGFSISENNWNQVCNGGILIGALAIADEEPQVAAYILEKACESLPRAMGGFAPDGGWIEGPAYWAYTTRYCIYLFAALETALGTTFGLDDVPGFAETGYFRVIMESPTGRVFNWGDGSERMGGAPQLFWLARRYEQPVFAWAERQFAARSPSPLDLLWLGEGKSPIEAKLPLDWHFRGIQVVALRQNWDDPKASYVALKGGDNDAPHANLDLGNFVFDSDGERWFKELGGDDYNLPGYWERANRRYKYYRLGTSGQNTLLINKQNQDRFAEAQIIRFGSDATSASAVVDLSAGYAQQATRVQRGIALCGERRHLLVQDEIESTTPLELEWIAHTGHDGKADGATATLTSASGATLRLQVLEPKDAIVAIESAEQEPPDARNEGIKRVVIRLPNKTTQTRLAVLLSPGSADEFRPEVVALDKWLK